MRKLIGVLCGVGAVVGLAFASWASPASGVTPTVLSRVTYAPFKVKTDAASPIDFEAKSKTDMDVVIRKHDYLPNGSTGWHMHPGPVFVTVVSGELTFYDYDDPTCTKHVVQAGHGYVDTGHGHIGRNETNAPAQDISVIMAPVGGAFRSELSAPGPYCSF